MQKQEKPSCKKKRCFPFFECRVFIFPTNYDEFLAHLIQRVIILCRDMAINLCLSLSVNIIQL